MVSAHIKITVFFRRQKTAIPFRKLFFFHLLIGKRFYDSDAGKIVFNLCIDIGNSCPVFYRFYDVSGGRILIDNTDIRDYTLKSLRNNIGIVQQDVYLFTGSVMECKAGR